MMMNSLDSFKKDKPSHRKCVCVCVCVWVGGCVGGCYVGRRMVHHKVKSDLTVLLCTQVQTESLHILVTLCVPTLMLL